MGGRGVAGNGLGEMRARLVRTVAQSLLDAAVLIAERDFQMDNPLAVAVETEVAGLDDAGMHWSNCDLVDFLTADAIKIRRADGRAARGKTHRLKPGMALRIDSPLLVNFALE